MEARLCPVCRKGKIWRNYVKTCSRHCSMTWNTWSPDMQGSAVESSLGSSIITIGEEQGVEEKPSGDKPEFLK
ncbi:hypothetical protein LCGC14_2902730 [marine sediment metagenome]|uniref:Uncharacterized protein n=1 Tax=marine sediment metagenome TaxID=412755 RepID=A0A0F9AK19_9ZZZZ